MSGLVGVGFTIGVVGKTFSCEGKLGVGGVSECRV